jgi:DNA-3-methyladenine glycosylase
MRAMARRRRQPLGRTPSLRALAALTSGPARLTQALGITVRDNGRDLRAGPLRIHDAVPRKPSLEVVASRRIGISRSPELALRFSLCDSPCVSRPPP